MLALKKTLQVDVMFETGRYYSDDAVLTKNFIPSANLL